MKPERKREDTEKKRYEIKEKEVYLMAEVVTNFLVVPVVSVPL